MHKRTRVDEKNQYALYVPRMNQPSRRSRKKPPINPQKIKVEVKTAYLLDPPVEGGAPSFMRHTETLLFVPLRSTMYGRSTSEWITVYPPNLPAGFDTA